MAQSNLEVSQAALYKIGCRTITSLAEASKEAAVCNARVDICKKAVIRLHPWKFATKRASISPTWASITNVVTSAGLFKITSAAHGRTTGDVVTIEQIVGCEAANGTWSVTVVDANNFTLDSSTFSGTYTSGGRWTLAAAFDYTYSMALPAGILRILKAFDSTWEAADTKYEDNRLLSMEYPIYLKYLGDVTDYTKMDILFYECLATYLAWDICDHLSADDSKKRAMWTDLMGGDGKVGLLSRARFVDASEQPSEALKADDWLTSRVGAPDANPPFPAT
jgi:hypothetical protein